MNLRDGLELSRGARLNDGKLDHETRATLWYGFGPDAAFMLPDDAERNRQPQAGARASRLRREEGIENPLDQICRNPAPRILDLDAHGVTAAPRADGEAMVVAVALFHRLVGVGDGVEEYLLELVRVRHRVRQRLVVFSAHVDAADPQLVASELERIIQYLVQGGRHLLGFVLPRERQQVLHDAAGAPRLAVNRLRRGTLIGWETFFGDQGLREGRVGGGRVVGLVRVPLHQMPGPRQLIGPNQLP